jgi:hypothetical protein
MDAIKETTDIILAVGGLGAAASSLVDASKAFWGGVSLVGLRHLWTALAPFAPTLKVAIGDWESVIRANWINGKPSADQKAIVRALIRLGLTRDNAGDLAKKLGLDPMLLAAAADKMANGAALSQKEQDVLGRLDAMADTKIGAAYERADQAYRNVAKLCASTVAIILAVLAGYILQDSASVTGYLWSSAFMKALLIGLAAVPLTPIAKDLTSTLQAAAAAVSKAKGRKS